MSQLVGLTAVIRHKRIIPVAARVLKLYADTRQLPLLPCEYVYPHMVRRVSLPLYWSRSLSVLTAASSQLMLATRCYYFVMIASPLLGNFLNFQSMLLVLTPVEISLTCTAACPGVVLELLAVSSRHCCRWFGFAVAVGLLLCRGKTLIICIVCFRVFHTCFLYFSNFSFHCLVSPCSGANAAIVWVCTAHNVFLAF